MFFMAVPWNAYWRLMRFDKPIGILLLLWPTWWALLFAGAGRPAWRNVVIFTAGVVLMRAAGCVMNDVADPGQLEFDPGGFGPRDNPADADEILRAADAAGGDPTKHPAAAAIGTAAACSIAAVSTAIQFAVAERAGGEALRIEGRHQTGFAARLLQLGDLGERRRSETRTEIPEHTAGGEGALDVGAAHHVVFGTPCPVLRVAFGAEGLDIGRPTALADNGLPGR